MVCDLRQDHRGCRVHASSASHFAGALAPQGSSSTQGKVYLPDYRVINEPQQGPIPPLIGQDRDWLLSAASQSCQSLRVPPQPL